MASELVLARRQLRAECYKLLEKVFENDMSFVRSSCATIITLATHVRELQQREERTHDD